MYKNPELERKRLAAIKWLGNRWILAKDYQFNPKHCPVSR